MNVSLERTSIYYQYHLFRSAKVVIAQHGGALCNIFFMQSSLSSGNNDRSSSSRSSKFSTNERSGDNVAKVIEIMPISIEGYKRSRYKNLANFCQVQYIHIDQSSEIAEVDIDVIVQHTVSALL